MKGARTEEIEGAKSLYYQAENGYKEALAYQEELYLRALLMVNYKKRL